MTNYAVRLLVLPAILLVLACGEKIEPGTTAAGKGKSMPARTAVAEITPQPLRYEATATITARTSSTVSSTLMGTIREVRVKEGDRVKAGDVLAVIDQRHVSAQRRQAEAALAEAKRAEASARSAREGALAGAELARATHSRYLHLIQDSSVSRQELDEVSARSRQAEAYLAQATAVLEAAGHRIQQAEAALSAAQVSEKDATVEAPYKGRITDKRVDAGDLASPGTPLFGIEQEEACWAEAAIPEEHIQALRIEQEVEVIVDAAGSRSFKGRIERIEPAADPRARSFQVKVAIDSAPEIRSGMFARVVVPVGEAGMILIPSTAVVQSGQLTGLYLVESDQTARFRLIRTGKAFGPSIEVLSGIGPGQRYVVAPPAGMADGATVEVPK